MNMDFKPKTDAPRPMPKPEPRPVQRPITTPTAPTPPPAPVQTPTPPIPMIKADEQPIAPPKKPKFYTVALKFVIKHKIIFSVAASIIAIAVILFSFLPIISINNVIYTNLDTEFTINKDQTAQIRYQDIKLSINHFINQSCPEEQQCFGGSSTQAVEYNLFVNGKQYTINSTWLANSSGYDIKTVSSDYSSTATVIISKSK